MNKKELRNYKNEWRRKAYQKRRKEKPWLVHLKWAKSRCITKCQKYYYGKGIKCFLTKEEIKNLWFKDKAYNLTKPSLDRIDNDGDYTYTNCRFIEWKLNNKLGRLSRWESGTHTPSYRVKNAFQTGKTTI